MSEKTDNYLAYRQDLVFRGSRNRLDETSLTGIEGAEAALETFYYSLNQRSLAILSQIWLDDATIQLNNPLGGIVRGIEPIKTLYGRIFEGPVRVKVEFYDVTVYSTSEMVVFAGRERGTYERDGKSYPLDIRTTRCFLYKRGKGGWRQIHHHGSIDNPELLKHYQQTVLGS